MNKASYFKNHRELENYRDLLIVLLQKEIKVRYKGKILGYLWSVASPLAYAFVYVVAFSGIMRVQVENYPLVLMSGLFPWQWLSNSISSAPKLFIGSASIIKKVNFPRSIVCLVAVLNHMVHFIVSVPVILLFLFIYNQAPNQTWLYAFPLLMIVHLATAVGASLFLASINVFFRDLERLNSIVLTFIFYFTPIIYPVDLIPEQYLNFIYLNPFAPLIINWRELILHNTINPMYLFASFIYSIVFLVIGYSVYRKLSWKFAEVI